MCSFYGSYAAGNVQKSVLHNKKGTKIIIKKNPVIYIEASVWWWLLLFLVLKVAADSQDSLDSLNDDNKKKYKWKDNDA